MQTPTTLVVDDEPAVRELVGHCLRVTGARVLLASGGNEGLDLLRRQPVDVLFTDLCLPTLDGISLLREAVKLRPDLASVIMTGYASIESSVEGLRLGVCDYVTKPITQEKIRSALARALRVQTSLSHAKPHFTAASPRGEKPEKSEFVAQSAALREILQLVARVAPTTAAVLIQGETGVGKGLIARMIHDQSPRADRPFIHANCSALSPELLQRELCGCEPGAMLANGDQRRGLFELASGGTLFLDNVDQLPLCMQGGLLDSLQDRRFYRVGGNDPVPMDVRVVSATMVDLKAEVAAGRFHRGLHDSLNVVCIQIPPLRYRPDDLRALTRHFFARFRLGPGTEQDGAGMRFSEAARECLLRHDWPGNVRELANVVQHAMLLAEGEEVGLVSLPESLRNHRPSETGERLSVPLVGDIKEIERKVIDQVIERCHGNKAAAARALGMHRRTLYRRLGPSDMRE